MDISQVSRCVRRVSCWKGSTKVYPGINYSNYLPSHHQGLRSSRMNRLARKHLREVVKLLYSNRTHQTTKQMVVSAYNPLAQPQKMASIAWPPFHPAVKNDIEIQTSFFLFIKQCWPQFSVKQITFYIFISNVFDNHPTPDKMAPLQTNLL